MDFYYADTKIHQNISSIITYELPDGQTGQLLALLEDYVTKSRDSAIEVYVREQIKLLVSHIQDIEFSKYSTLSHFPSEIDISTGEKHYTQEFCWSRGDLPILVLLYKADKTFGTNQYSFIANTIGSIIARRTQIEVMNQNPFIRHGTAGIAQCFWSLHQQSNKSFYKEAYHFWITETHRYLSLGYSETLPNTILDGMEGVKMVLNSSDTNNNKDWTKRILL
jgi:Lanthionine synthetase C-like protein